MQKVPESAWERFAAWVADFGNEATGLIALAMILLALVVAWCLPKMWKDLLDYKKSTKELEPEVKKIDLLITEKVERLLERGAARVEIVKDKVKKERKK